MNSLFYFKQYLFGGAQFSEAGLNGALMKKKKQHTRQIKIKMEQLNKYNKSKGGSIRLGSKMPL